MTTPYKFGKSTNNCDSSSGVLIRGITWESYRKDKRDYLLPLLGKPRFLMGEMPEHERKKNFISTEPSSHHRFQLNSCTNALGMVIPLTWWYRCGFQYIPWSKYTASEPAMRKGHTYSAPRYTQWDIGGSATPSFLFEYRKLKVRWHSQRLINYLFGLGCNSIDRIVQCFQ